MADEDTLFDAQLGEEVFQVIGHRLIGQHRAVRAVAMVTGIYSQHLTGQRTVRTLGTGGKSQQSGNKKTFMTAVSFFFFFLAPAQASDSTNKGCIVHMR